MELNELKKALNQSQFSIEACKRLMEERDNIHAELIHLKSKVENDLLKLHRLREKKSLEAARIEEEIKLDTERVSLLKTKLKEIDTQLDEVGEEQEVSLERIKKEILSKIEEKFPDFKSEYQKLNEVHNIKREELSIAMSEQKKLNSFYQALHEGQNVAPRRGFFGLLFGRHPKIVMSQSIHKATIEAEKLQKEIKDPRFIRFFNAFLQETQKKWNPSLYKGKYAVFFKEFSELMDSLNQEIEQKQLEAINAEKNVNDLIESYCK